ncbi:hydroxypyruvate isomerase family protein [Achromobacter sp. Marseille-Q0513]|uniref:2-oxo-tetronate isomerase n=1 Tax=Achromobacter sp. Marseille-Q0513 TaxID=2829161 RepID=UPI001BA2EDD8|nr:hydroxypyruvate isomerase family protein [Achromobacter sp. Marseille-Q0513]
MPRLAANLSMMYTEHPFLERFAAAARDGFQAVEFLFPYEHPAAEIRARLDSHGLAQALFNAPPGDWQAGERGIASLPGRQEEFRRGMDQALEYAARLGNRSLHVMAGLIAPGQDRAAHRAASLENLAHATRLAAGAGITIVIEPINPRDMPGFFLTRQDEAQAIRAELGAANLKVQFDCYHCQIVEGDLAMKLRRDMAGIGHIQIAGVPDRHEPDLGELNYPYLFEQIDALGYDGWIGCEYRPRAGTSAGLGWARPYLNRGA